MRKRAIGRAGRNYAVPESPPGCEPYHYPVEGDCQSEDNAPLNHPIGTCNNNHGSLRWAVAFAAHGGNLGLDVERGDRPCNSVSTSSTSPCRGSRHFALDARGDRQGGRGGRLRDLHPDGPLVPDGAASPPRRTRCSRATPRSASWPGQTERMTLGLLVTGVTYRHPGLLAKIVTTLDVLSGGRALLGHRRGLVRARAPRPRRALPAGERAVRAARGDAPDLPADVERRRRPLRGQALPAGRDDLLAAADPAARGRRS